ncbi:MAG: TM2 domain-containing protein, partial [Thermoguttaceae bacterium]|nr:TM2 domain-containing protein [Thermoguttaceae bacterium]
AAGPQASAAVYCTNCGNPVEEQAYACMKCGASPVGHNKFCRRCGTALNPEQIVCVKCGTGVAAAQNRPGGHAARGAAGPGYGAPGYDGPRGGEPKSKLTAGLLALLLGGVGVHKFYMGSWGWGIVFVAAVLLTGGFGGIATGICALVEGILYLTMSQEQFEEKYPPQTEAPFRW